jgi:phage-related protein
MMKSSGKPLVWLHGEIRTPPFSSEARIEAGFRLRQLQIGETIAMPHLRPMPDIGPRCHELRINDGGVSWRIVLRIDDDAIVIVDVFSKKTRTTPQSVMAVCQRRLKEYDNA